MLWLLRTLFYTLTVFLYSNSITRVIPRQRTKSTSRSQASTSDSSDGSVEGQYNFAAEGDEIDEGMFAGDRNSGSHDPQDIGLPYMDPARLNHDTPSFIERSVDDVIRLENYKPRINPSASRKNGATVYADINDSKGTEGLNDLSKGSDKVTKPGPSSDDLLDSEPPNWVPPPPPVNISEPPGYSQEDETRGTSPDKLVGSSDETTKHWVSADRPSSSRDSSEDDNITHRLTAEETEPPPYNQVDLSAEKKSQATAQGNFTDSAKTEPHSVDTSEDDDTIDWPPPPPPPRKSSYQPDDSDWERPLPPEIIALPGKRNRIASWARDEGEGSNDFDDLSKI